MSERKREHQTLAATTRVKITDLWAKSVRIVMAIGIKSSCRGFLHFYANVDPGSRSHHKRQSGPTHFQKSRK
jgi:hypothetical protein